MNDINRVKVNYLSRPQKDYSVLDQSELGLPQKSEGGFAEEDED